MKIPRPSIGPATMVAAAAFTVLWRGNDQLIEWALIFLVLLMSLAFLLTFALTKPDLSTFFKGLTLPSVPTDSGLTVIALIGTTVVPYNLFLHSSSAGRNGSIPNNSPTRAGISIFPSPGRPDFHRHCLHRRLFRKTGDIGHALQPLFGNSAQYFMGLGLFAAGISSALATAKCTRPAGPAGNPAAGRAQPGLRFWLTIANSIATTPTEKPLNIAAVAGALSISPDHIALTPKDGISR